MNYEQTNKSDSDDDKTKNTDKANKDPVVKEIKDGNIVEAPPAFTQVEEI